MAAFCVCIRFYVQNAPYRLFVDWEQLKQQEKRLWLIMKRYSYVAQTEREFNH